MDKVVEIIKGTVAANGNVDSIKAGRYEISIFVDSAAGANGCVLQFKDAANYYPLAHCVGSANAYDAQRKINITVYADEGIRLAFTTTANIRYNIARFYY